jgi:hypothetical protein
VTQFLPKKEILSLMCLKRLNFDADGVTRFWPKKGNFVVDVFKTAQL